MDNVTLIKRGQQEYKKHTLNYIILKNGDSQKKFIAASMDTDQVVHADCYRSVVRLIRKINRDHIDFCMEHGFDPFTHPDGRDDINQYADFFAEAGVV